jgi:cellulose synthase/poly-beta-1,6-N-acetylglucosamine synthase-like glycosyltransferase
LKKSGIFDFAPVDCAYRFFVSHRAELCKPLDFLDFLSISVVLCWVVLVYTWVGYPLMLILVTHGRLPHETSREKNRSVDTEFSPTVTVLVAAHNEEKHIGARIKNLIELDYPENRVTVRVGVDGSSDRTADVARQWASKYAGIRVYEVAERRGKIAMLKDLVAQSDENILVFTDANTEFKPDALYRLVSHFRDSDIGGVCGRIVQCGEGEFNTYWRMESRLKMMESALDSCLGAHGAIYAIRRALFWDDVPDNTIVDDFVIGMKVREQGFRVIYEPRAVAQEDLPPATHEWARRKRIGAGDYQALSFCRACLLPKYGKFAWMFWSHKVLRWFTPHILMMLFVSSFCSLCIGLLQEPVQPYIVKPLSYLTPALLSATLLCVLVGRFLRKFESAYKSLLSPLLLCEQFLTMQAGLFVGFIRFCRGDLKGHWTRTPRE